MTALSERTKKTWARGDMRALWLGIIFSFVFTGVIWLLAGRLDSIALLPDQGASWYYWKLPEPTFWSQFSVWFLYLAHQFALWGLIYYAQKNVNRYTTGLHKVNVLALALNAVFILLHLVQTHIWYDGLAQNVSVWSSQISVIILLVWVLLMENSRRGLILGKKMPVSREVNRVARKYHGYYFAWAIVYTFWFHPMVATTGHLMGFLYMFLLLLQGSLFFTRVHVNRWWTFAQEFIVLLHGTIVAVEQGAGLWPMFAFGFGALFILTQMYGLGLSRRTRWGLIIVYIVLALLVYNSRGWVNLNEIIRIPVIEYLSTLILALIFAAALRLGALARRFWPTPVGEAQRPIQAAGD